jgi:hypothetical protein
MIIHADNMRAIQKINQRRKHPRTINQHCDSKVDLELQLLDGIRMVECSAVTVELCHVTSHDVNTKTKDLMNIEKLHCRADGLAKEA